jgi:hypothetical protein
MLQPLGAGGAFEAALDDVSPAIRVTCTIGLWAVWVGVLVATLVLRPVSLTVVRIAVPAALAATVWAVVLEPVDAEAVLAVVGTGLATAAAMHPVTADAFVDGASYGDERRLALRPPGPLLLGPIEGAWIAVVVGTITGPLLLAAQAWVGGALAVVVGFPLAALAARALHGLARRWIVLVPNGLVVHDLATLADPILVPRAHITRLGAAPADTDATDLTAGALGLALEIDLDGPIDVVRMRGRRSGEVEQIDALLVSPSRPATLLAEAAKRRLPVD